jgi:hypothetical protein
MFYPPNPEHAFRHFSAVVAIDPGASGAAVIFPQGEDDDDTGERVIRYTGDASIAAALKAIADIGGLPFIALEEVHASPVMGPAKAFSFGNNFGGWRLALKTAGYVVHGVTPQEWQHKYRLSGLRGPARKRALKEAAAEAFPFSSIYLWNADAYLLGDYVESELGIGIIPGKVL